MTLGALDAAEEFIGTVSDFPTLSTVMEQVLEAADDPSASFRRISSLIELDPALSAGVLKVANSSYYQASSRIASIHQAITRIGDQEVRNIVLATGVISAFQRISQNLDWSRFWEHCFAAGIASHVVSRPAELGKQIDTHGRNPFYAAGLMHHLGVLAEIMQAPAEFQRASFLTVAEGISLSEAEQKVFGFTHAESGAALLRRWRFPDFIVDAAAFHHDPNSYVGEHHPAVQAVHLSTMLCRTACPEYTLEGPQTAPAAQSYAAFGWSPEQVPTLTHEVRRVYARAKALAQAHL